jgi:chromosome segregation protein
MKLRALRLHGFKSFADKTEILFHDGITAIVGPNGCGKSNISDAIRWVLGEQRPTAIRGAKMEEAIFQGTVNRRPVNRGSVSMDVSNEDGALPVPFSEVEITRTVYRDGGSDYFLNRTACRLRDVLELCRDTGLGANAYAIIENRMIDAILSDRAEERRALFEEAAGVGKYKDRRKEASRRLERAEVDLQRLEDLIAEVQSKVRSLARQKGAAERYGKLRKRRLDLEMALAGRQLTELGSRLGEVRGMLAGDVQRDESLKAQVSEVETRLETLRLEQVKLEKARAGAGKRADEIRVELVRWERELAVADERIVYDERRLGQIAEERAEAEREIEESAERDREVAERREAVDSELAAVLSQVDVHQERVEEARGALATARNRLTEVEGQEQELARRIAQLQGDADAAETRGQELEDRLTLLGNELSEARLALSEATSQGDLFTDQLESLLQTLEAARRDLDGMQGEMEAAHEAFDRARDREMEAQDSFGTVSARYSALSLMEKDREGADPAVQAVLAESRDGVLGVLADFLSSAPEYAGTLEAVLGTLLNAVVVRDTRVAVKLSRWFMEEWDGGGGLIVLPLDRVPPGEDSGDLVREVRAEGAGAPWVRALLRGFDLDGESAAPLAGASAQRVARGGAWVERGGALHLGNPSGSTGVLERREQVAELETEVARAEEKAAAAAKVREEAAAHVESLERSHLETRAALQSAEDAYREARSEQAERTSSLARMEHLVRELEGRQSMTQSALQRARDRVEETRESREELLQKEEELREERGEARDVLELAQDGWEEVRGEASRLQIERTRLEGDIARIDERQRDFERAEAAAAARVESLSAEAQRLEEERERSRSLVAEGKVEIERLFGLRDAAEAELGARDQELAELQEGLANAEREVREVRNAERVAAEEKHVLELEEQEIRGRISRIQDRLEGEWGRSLERLLEEAEEIDLDGDEVEEHEEESARLSFLTEQRDDLVEARDDLRAAIREINETATGLFAQTFEAIRENFRDTFLRLFEGGECDLWLEDPEDPLESDVEIHAAPHGKRTQRIDLLSGGERALTALSLLFGIYLVKPSPFCVLDEVDAPLDESNIGRFIRLLQEFKSKSQFVVITHNPRTIEAADWIYGVTMEEPGVSSIVGVRLDEALQAAAS